jgi:hypothetical protein
MVASRVDVTNPPSPGFVGGNASFTDQFVLDRASEGSLFIYGWLELSNSVSATLGPEVTVVAWAWDTSGNPIRAGDVGAPEPSTLALTGLAALAFGATGLRRWRAARRP